MHTHTGAIKGLLSKLWVNSKLFNKSKVVKNKEEYILLPITRWLWMPKSREQLSYLFGPNPELKGCYKIKKKKQNEL